MTWPRETTLICTNTEHNQLSCELARVPFENYCASCRHTRMYKLVEFLTFVRTNKPALWEEIVKAREEQLDAWRKI